MITITCDRCKLEVKDFIIGEASTGSFYQVRYPGYWSKFANEGESEICDSCMHKDERYIEVYRRSNG